MGAADPLVAGPPWNWLDGKPRACHTTSSLRIFSIGTLTRFTPRTISF